MGSTALLMRYRQKGKEQVFTPGVADQEALYQLPLTCRDPAQDGFVHSVLDQEIPGPVS